MITIVESGIAGLDRFSARAELARVVTPGSKVFLIEYGPELLGVFTIIPFSVLSDKVYIWLHVTDDVAQHKIAFGRRARRLIVEIFRHSSAILCHCDNLSSEAWIRSVGGVKTGESLNMPVYSIEREGNGC